MMIPFAEGRQLGRRQFLRSVAGLGLSAAGLALLDGCASQPTAPGVATETLETTTIRLLQAQSICVAPLYIAEDLLKAEGFTEVQYVKAETDSVTDALRAGLVDFGMQFSGPTIVNIDVGMPLTVLAGVHVGCFVLFTKERVNSIGDLKGNTVGISSIGSVEHVFLASILSYVGMNPNTDINWTVTPNREDLLQQFKDGKLDSWLAFPPSVQELQAKKIGHVVVDGAIDKPWSQYFCCMVTGRQEFVQQNPVAAKRALRAILKATDIAVREPERGAKIMVDRKFTSNYDYALQTLQHLPYNHWRDYDPTDTLRFFALRLHDAGMIKLSPDEIIAKSVNWRFLNELKQEMPTSAASAGNSRLLCHVGKPG
jgi:NitT/TauT family transport system substrate-binding protein